MRFKCLDLSICSILCFVWSIFIILEILFIRKTGTYLYTWKLFWSLSSLLKSPYKSCIKSQLSFCIMELVQEVGKMSLDFSRFGMLILKEIFLQQMPISCTTNVSCIRLWWYKKLCSSQEHSRNLLLQDCQCTEF